jgi:purine-binding chemotaxis protein CheW
VTIAPIAQIVTFRLGHDLFAADINEVERVLRYAEPTPVPNVPAWVQGVIEYRSQVVPVIDLRARFELPLKPADGATRLMVLTTGGEWIAAMVDAVLEVVPLAESQLAPPPPLFGGLSAEFLRGILRRHDRLIIVLDVARLLTTRERLAFDRPQAAEHAGIGSFSPNQLEQIDVRTALFEPHGHGDGEAGSGDAHDSLQITRSGEPLLSEPFESTPPAGESLPLASSIGLDTPTAPPPTAPSDGGDDNQPRRADG